MDALMHELLTKAPPDAEWTVAWLYRGFRPAWATGAAVRLLDAGHLCLVRTDATGDPVYRLTDGGRAAREGPAPPPPRVRRARIPDTLPRGALP